MKKKSEKPKDNRKKVFTVLGEIVFVEGRKKLQFNSPEVYRTQLEQLPVGKKLGVTIEEYKSTRSAEQLAYYWVILGYISRHTGHSGEELHDVLMRNRWGTKEITVGGITETVRRSISDSARFPKYDMMEQIQFALDLALELGIVVPTPKQAGYISNK